MALQFQLQKIPEASLRLGRLSLRESAPKTGVARVLETPTFVVTTQRGTVPHLTADNADQVSPGIVTIFAEHLLEYVPTPILESDLDGRRFFNIKNDWIIFDVRDPSKEHKAKDHSKKIYRAETSGGVRQMTLDQYVTLARKIRPDVLVALSDDLNGPMESKDRVQKSVSCTLHWLDQIREADTGDMGILATLKGAHLLDQRKHSAEQTATREAVDGFVLDDLHFAPSAQAQLDWISASVGPLPSAKPRLAYLIPGPNRVLDSIDKGIDLFDSAYPLQMTDAGQAIAFRFSGPPSTSSEAKVTPAPAGLDLHDTVFKSDMTPLQAGCSCLTCRKYTRAYVHHLLVTKEMLASVLLIVHNLQTWGDFFAKIRGTLQEGHFSQAREQFRQSYPDLL
ncbi:hypothetical protein H4R33_000510 [Dimargaris cristalligena]|uniref:Queuine tRNA-ribosyltransferase accessory subunit 2 n=1 Tax=Dimargaris cristalligena TaxID=215637 RepID=A0A4P9ZYF7_9FUNG|nr:hypothetical protein H4R33_000510 [Dimargaris cristalligena]RKP38408.1 tRNA-guanine(15) transglycosylase-like protein [Dimargaris cristalligena]|eukprot:RKP38408.1 tRNA-guanine(15) transglycosylase-like protein [Dimargaris cristalligena]